MSGPPQGALKLSLPPSKTTPDYWAIQALLVSRGSAQQHVKDLLESTIAIAFMGTPHLGSNHANWSAPLTRLSNLLNSEIVGVLRPGSEMLASLQQEFHTMLEDRSRNGGKFMEIFCFYEKVAYPGIGEVRFVALSPIFHVTHMTMLLTRPADCPKAVRNLAPIPKHCYPRNAHWYDEVQRTRGYGLCASP